MATQPLPPRQERWSPGGIVVVAVLFAAALIGVAYFAHLLLVGTPAHPDWSYDWNAVKDKCGYVSRMQMDDSRAYMKGDVAVYPSLNGGQDQTVNERTGEVSCYVVISPTPVQ